MVTDIHYLLRKESDNFENGDSAEDQDCHDDLDSDENRSSSDAIYLWDGVRGTVKNGIQYGKERKV